MENSERRLVLLSPDDNCVDVAQSLRAGDTVAVARGTPTKSEALGHQEFVLTYKAFEPIGPACLPAAA